MQGVSTLLQITDAGAELLLDALAMDCSMALLDLSANQLTMARYAYQCSASSRTFHCIKMLMHQSCQSGFSIQTKGMDIQCLCTLLAWQLRSASGNFKNNVRLKPEYAHVLDLHSISCADLQRQGFQQADEEAQGTAAH